MCEVFRLTVLHLAFVVLSFGRMSTVTGKIEVAVVKPSKPESASLSQVMAASDEATCFNFSVGNPHKREFYSPNYPGHYPKNTKCTLRITADVGHIVKVDFRDHFRLEQSPNKCEYDRLEIRDGAYGYSPEITNSPFCGSEFPKGSPFQSTRRHMWLQFSSDDSIEYEGFRAVYDFIPVANQAQNGHTDIECTFYRTGSSGLIEKTEIEHLWNKYRQEDTFECMWTIETEADKKIYMNFKKYRLAKPNDCEQNFIQLYDGRTPDKNLALFCGTSSEPQKSDSNMTHVRLFTHRDAFNGTDFQLHYTSFSEINASAGKKQCDPRTEFNCGDQTCIDVLLKCDGEFDCKYRYDEEATLCTRELGTGTVLTSEHMIIILVVFFSLVAAMCASISISCYNKIRDRRMREREYKERRSKEASVEVTLSSVPPPRPAQRAERMADDESSDGGGCYVPEVDMSVFSNNKQQQRPNGGDTIPKSKLRQQPHAQHYPYISESFESLASDVIVPPAPPPVPSHMRPRRDPSPPPPSYRIVAGKVVAANPVAKSIEAEPLMSSSRASTLDHNNSRNEVDPKSSWLRGPLESGAPSRTPYEPASRYKGVMSSRVTPAGPSTGGARGPLGSAYKVQGPRPYQPTPVGDASDSSRAHSVASTLSAPDALLGKR